MKNNLKRLVKLTWMLAWIVPVLVVWLPHSIIWSLHNRPIDSGFLFEVVIQSILVALSYIILARRSRKLISREKQSSEQISLGIIWALAFVTPLVFITFIGPSLFLEIYGTTSGWQFILGLFFVTYLLLFYPLIRIGLWLGSVASHSGAPSQNL